MQEANPSSQDSDLQQSTTEQNRVLPRCKRILFTLFTVAVLMVFVEGTLQLFYRVTVGKWLWDWWAIPIYEEDPIRVYRLKANLDYWHKTSEYVARYRTDEVGMRTDGQQSRPLIPKPKDCFRILSLGPSFAFGWAANYEDSYMHRLASGLKVPGKRVELVNLGTPSQPIRYQLKWLRETGYVYQPDLIVQTIYGDGGDISRLDIDDSLPDDRPYVRNGHLYPGKQMTLSMRIRWLRRYSAGLFYGWRVYRALSRPGMATGDGKEFYTKVAPAGSSTLDDCVKRSKSYIQFVHGAVTNQPQIVFIFVPTSWIVRPADIARVAHHGGTHNSFAARERIALLSRILITNQINFIDTTPALVQHDDEARTYHLYDIHFTAFGNKVLADHALPIIQRILLGTFGLPESRESVLGP